MIDDRTEGRPSIGRRFVLWFRQCFFGCGRTLCHVAAAVTGSVIGAEISSLYFPSMIGGVLAFALSFGVLEAAFFLLRKFFKRFLDHELGWLMALGSTVAALCVAVQKGAGEGWSWRVFFTAGLIAATLWLLTASWWSIFWRGTRLSTVCHAVVSSVAAILLLIFFAADGFADGIMRSYLSLMEHPQGEAVLSAAMGTHTVSVLDYGPGEALEPDAVNLNSYATRGDSLTELYVDAYMEYGMDEVPLRGRVWYPSTGDHYPVLFIAHGNHEITTQSYLGYGYLGEYLASYGYVVVSVDQNACNMLSNENDARAVLLLEHIRVLLEYNECKDNVLYRKIDKNNIAVAGHSRGGEMVATAYLFNGYDRYPENGVIRFDYGFSIKSLIAIAPTVNQYKPADHSVEIENVNYLLLHGAADRDVTSFMGMSQYENVSFAGPGDYIKSALYIAGANHGQFNSLWGEYDCGGAGAAFLNTENLLSEQDQQKIACLFVKAFLDVTLKGDMSRYDLLTDWEDYAAHLPETVYVQCHEESGFVPLADFEEDSEVETATMAGVKLHASGVNWWTEDLMDFAGRSAYDTHALRLRWSDKASFTLQTPALDLTNAALTFDICDLDSAAVCEGNLDLLDATVYLKDGDGNAAVAQLSDFATVYPVLVVKTDKLDYIFDTPAVKEAFATVSIPTDEFEVEDGAFDLSDIRKIEFWFHDGGQIAMDNIGITPV